MKAGADQAVVTAQALAGVLDLARRARAAGSARELGFLLVNESHALASYRQAALWINGEGLHTLSGVVQLEANAPYAQWVERVAAWLARPGGRPLGVLAARDLPPELAQEWGEWWPDHALWLPMPDAAGDTSTAPAAALLLAREQAWSAEDLTLLREWTDAWWHAFLVLHRPRVGGWQALRTRVGRYFAPQPGRRWWQQVRTRWLAAVLALLVFPVRLSVMAPGELVPAQPVVIRAPLDGVVDVFHVQPNQLVHKGQPLFGFDEALIQSKLDVAAQALATAETEYRQVMQQALSDVRAKPQLAMLTGKIEEKRTEVMYLEDQLGRARVLAPQDGVALFDDPSEWIGKPVSVGERIMRIAVPGDVEVEAWLPLADAIALAPGATAQLYLNASPLQPVSARLRYQAHDAVQRPDGGYAYRVRATPDGVTAHRVGLKGTAKLHGSWVPLVYWVLRRPWAAVRTTLGL
ncbi:MAG: HlyD family efflux transporter periplasmic adaptor subunit [Hylemonella sp.]|nr:HlyD family efflux transporter periplasmic adaptor subunit [Hylemonella sp.]